MEAELHDLQTQIQNFEQRKGKLHHSLRSTKLKTNAEAGFKFYQSKSSSCKYNLQKARLKERIRGRLILKK